MEENTVLLSLEKYDRLLEAQKKVNELKDKTILIQDGLFGIYECLADDEATAKLAKDLKAAKAEISQLKIKTLALDTVKKMNWREFKKWKRM